MNKIYKINRMALVGPGTLLIGKHLVHLVNLVHLYPASLSKCLLQASRERFRNQLIKGGKRLDQFVRHFVVNLILLG
jgi:hypothetical protein